MEEVIYSQGEPYPEEPYENGNWELGDNAEHKERPLSQTREKYRSYGQEKHLNRPSQSTNNSRCLKYDSSHQVPLVSDDVEEVM